jgi:hypothetical protein
MCSASVAWKHDREAAEALQDFQASSYEFAGIDLPDRLSREHWQRYCESLAHVDENDAEWNEFSRYLAARPPLGFESWDQYVGLMRSFYNLRRTSMLSLRVERLSGLEIDQLVFGTIPSGQPTATIVTLRGSKAPAILIDVGLFRALPWVSLLYGIMMAPVGGSGCQMVPARITEDPNAIAVGLAVADRLVEYLLTGVIGHPPRVEGKPEWMVKIERSQVYVTEIFIVGHEIAHLLLGHVGEFTSQREEDAIQVSAISHAEEFDADLLGLELAIHANRAALSINAPMSLELQAIHDTQAVAFVEFYLWFYQAIEVLLCRQRFGDEIHHGDTESHPSAALRRFTFVQSAVNYLSTEGAFRSSGIGTAMKESLDSQRNCHSYVWSVIIQVAQSKLQEKLKSGSALAPVWSSLRPCEIPEFLRGRPIAASAILGPDAGQNPKRLPKKGDGLFKRWFSRR